MPEQMSADFEQVMAQCSRGCFTGLLRVRTREGNGEVRFLSGIQDGIRFDTVEGDAALERLQTASDHEFEAISSLPPINPASNEAVPIDGRLEHFHAAQLMRYCESNSLTCALELEVEGIVLTARYRLGELLSVEPDSEHTARLAEAKVGMYRFRLPRFELPANVQQRRSAPAPAKAAASKPAPASVQKPAAPAAVQKPAAAALAETPLVGLRPVSVGSAPAKAPAKAPTTPASVPPPASMPASTAARAGVSSGASPVSRPGPSASRPAPAPAATRPAASSSERPLSRREEAPRQAHKPAEPSVAARAEARSGTPSPETPVMPLVQTKSAAAPAPGAATAAPRVPRSPVPPAPAAAAPAARAAAAEPSPSSAPASPAPKSASLEGLWKDAVKPPPQSAPVELEAGARASASLPASPGVGTGKAARGENLSSLVYKAEEAAAPTRRQRASLGDW